ncbi:hypothetical protein Pcinc_027185 [Petrolisthes cinctipes]|uniref:Uncharacterized protein n=1 Tax=Petrolisthes cinctipes TaxID=88211 RepID=A0AAE1F4I9_PETCI|nr:hypothetical protein Pcinc_027185 [Petrolisthes cinctipes]
MHCKNKETVPLPFLAIPTNIPTCTAESRRANTDHHQTLTRQDYVCDDNRSVAMQHKTRQNTRVNSPTVNTLKTTTPIPPLPCTNYFNPRE